MYKIVMFPGQGSQVLGMGKDLFEEYPKRVAEADKILGYSIVDLCLNGEEKLGQTLYTQPALFVVNALSYLKMISGNGKTPDFCIGHSLGEYNALLAAGVFDFATGLGLVKRRAEIMNKQSGGAMAAVMGLDSSSLKEVLIQEDDKVDIANLNCPGQIIISGLKEEIELLQQPLKAAGASNFILLKVSGAFHSRYMKEAQNSFVEFLEGISFQSPKIPVYANCSVGLYEISNVKANLGSQISSSVRWIEIIECLMNKGECEFMEVGPGRVLAGLIKRIQRARKKVRSN